jgi:hypothetical protein
VVSAADPPRALISVFSTGAATFLSNSSSFTLTRAEWTLFQTHCYSENLVGPGIEPGPLGLQPGTLATRPQRRARSCTLTSTLMYISLSAHFHGEMLNQLGASAGRALLSRMPSTGTLRHVTFNIRRFGGRASIIRVPPKRRFLQESRGLTSQKTSFFTERMNSR